MSDTEQRINLEDALTVFTEDELRRMCLEANDLLKIDRAEILRLRAQVAALLKVKEAAVDFMTFRTGPAPLRESITAYTAWENGNADK